MGDKNQKKKDLEHHQKATAKAKKFNEAVDRQVALIISRDGKIKVEGERQDMILAVLVFLSGLFLVVALGAYVVGVVIYG